MDAQQILAHAKKHMLKSGEHEPIVWVITQDKTYILPVTTEQWNRGANARKKVLFAMGRTLATQEVLSPDDITALYFAQEMWYVMRPIGEPLPDSPAKDLDRKEMLVVLELIVNAEQTRLEQCMYGAEIIRHGGMIDLASTRQMQEPDTMLLLSLLGGICSAEWSDEEFSEKMRRFQDVGEF